MDLQPIPPLPNHALILPLDLLNFLSRREASYEKQAISIPYSTIIFLLIRQVPPVYFFSDHSIIDNDRFRVVLPTLGKL